MIDKINKRARQEGKSEQLAVKRIYRDEIDERVEAYLIQAEKQIEDGRMAQAKLTIQKILFLKPAHRQSQRMYEQVQSERPQGGS